MIQRRATEPRFPFSRRTRGALRFLCTFGALVAAAGLVGGGRAALAAPAGYDLIFADEFVGTNFGGAKVDPMKWGQNYSWGNQHNHRAYMADSQIIVGKDELGNSRLNLQAIAQRHPSATDGMADGAWQVRNYTSGAINSFNTLRLDKGFVEARIRMDDVQGSWPAFWLTHAVTWPPEIDVMEFPRGANNSATQYWANYHYTQDGKKSEGWQTNTPNLTTGYNTFAVEWTSNSMRFYLNGNVVRTVQNTSSIAQATNMYLILNHAVGGWAGDPPSDAPFPANYEIDWVRVWQQRDAGQTTLSTWNVNGGGTWDTAGSWTGGVPKFGNQEARFGRVGAASTAAVTWTNSRAVGSVVFTGALGGTTGYTIGNSSGSLMFAGSAAQIHAQASSQANQTIASRIDLWSDVQVRNEMTGGQLLSLTGTIIGDRALVIDGPGVVVVSGNNNYSGGTIIDSGTQGPAVLRVGGTLNALGTGTVAIGGSGNATTARLELGGFRWLTNNIDLRGRTNNSVAIQSTSGTNTLSGTLTTGAGGNIYQIQSDAGSLNLTGAAPTATAPGVSIQAHAGAGDRNITLQGAGNGTVGGIIRDGGGKILITKAGAGTWTFSGANTYTGATDVTGGKLVLASSLTSSAAMNIAAGATTELAAGSGAVLKTPSLTIDAAGKLDVKNNKAVIAGGGAAGLGTFSGGSYTGILGKVAAGRGDGTWNGAGGITTSMSHAVTGLTTLAVALASETPHAGSNFGGVSVSGSDVLVMYTYGGDADLNGQLDSDDYFAIDSNFNLSGSVFGYTKGDFDYNGAIDSDDYFIIDSNFNNQTLGAFPTSADSASAAVTVVPEPTAVAIAGMMVAAGLLRRRR